MTEDASSTGWCEGEQERTTPVPYGRIDTDRTRGKDTKPTYFMDVMTPTVEPPRVRVAAEEPVKPHTAGSPK